MAAFCIVTPLADKIKAALNGNSDIFKNSTSEERRKFFEEFTDKETAKQINAGFEGAMLSKQKGALKSWATRTFKAEDKKAEGRFKSVIEKISEQMDVLDMANQDVFLEDLVAERLGASVTAAEAKKIVELTTKLTSLNESFYGDLPSLPSVEYWKAKRELDNYLDSLVPTSNTKVFTSIIGRATMLASVKSPIVNIESNTVNAIAEAFGRRIEQLATGVLPKKSKNRLSMKYLNYANKVFLQTGYDVTRMININDGRKTLGEETIHSQGKGLIRKMGRVYTDIVFNKLMTAPDVAFASMHFTDAANLKAHAIARTEGLTGQRLQARVEQLFLDAASLDPKTKEGRSIRDKAILEAQRATYTNPTSYSKTALALRGVLNDAFGDARVGDQLMPFVQVPANVVGASLDYSGISFLTGIAKMKSYINDIGYKNFATGKHDAEAFQRHFDRRYWRSVTRAGIGITVAFILSSWFDAEDFIGEYPTTPKEQELLKLKNASTNSLRIGNKWVSLDYFGPLAGPLVGMMYAKKYGDTPQDKILNFAKGVGLQTSRIPGFRQFFDVYSAMQELRPDRNATDDIKEASVNYIVDFFRSRTVPAIISDIAKGTDNVRQTDGAMDRFISSFPGLRQKFLEEKLDVFGEVVEGEGFWSSMLAGSRLKSAKDEPVINELARLAEKGQLPAITDVSKTSPRSKELKTQIGDGEFRKFYIEFGTEFRSGIAELVEDGEYLDASDDEKKSMIDGLKKTIFNDYLDYYGYEKPEKED